jgi:hypothetical protein
VPLIVRFLIGIAAYKLSGILVALISVVAILALAYFLWLWFT